MSHFSSALSHSSWAWSVPVQCGHGCISFLWCLGLVLPSWFPKRLCRGGDCLPWAAPPWPGGRAGSPVLGRAAAVGLGGTQFASILRTPASSGGSCATWSISSCQFSWTPNCTIGFLSLIGLLRSGGSDILTAVKGAGSPIRTLDGFLGYPLCARRWVMQRPPILSCTLDGLVRVLLGRAGPGVAFKWPS
jgi:hypothetical protein